MTPPRFVLIAIFSLPAIVVGVAPVDIPTKLFMLKRSSSDDDLGHDPPFVERAKIEKLREKGKNVSIEQKNEMNKIRREKRQMKMDAMSEEERSEVLKKKAQYQQDWRNKGKLALLSTSSSQGGDLTSVLRAVERELLEDDKSEEARAGSRERQRQYRQHPDWRAEKALKDGIRAQKKRLFDGRIMTDEYEKNCSRLKEKYSPQLGHATADAVAGRVHAKYVPGSRKVDHEHLVVTSQFVQSFHAALKGPSSDCQ